MAQNETLEQWKQRVGYMTINDIRNRLIHLEYRMNGIADDDYPLRVLRDEHRALLERAKALGYTYDGWDLIPCRK